MPFGGTRLDRRLRHRHARGRGRRAPPASSTSSSSSSRAACAPRSRSGRSAPPAPRTWTTASTWRSPRPTTPRFADMAPMVEEGICTFKVFLAYKGVIMVTDDLFFRVLENTRDLGALTMVHCENGWAIDVLVERALAAGQTEPIYHAHTRPEELEAEATSRSVRFAELTGASVYIVHVTCGLAADEIAAGQARGVDVSAETCLQYLTNTVEDLERPDFEGARYVCSPPLREAHNQELLWSGAAARRARERLDRPLPVQQRAEGARARRLLEDPERPRDDPAPAREAVGPRRRRRADHAQRARRPDLDRDRPPLRAAAEGRGGARQGRRPRHLRPGHAVRVLDADLAHERRLRPVRGRALDRQRAPDVLPRHARLRPRRDQDAARARPLRAALARCAARPWPRDGDGRGPRARGPARAGPADRRARRRAARLLDGRVGEGARVPALAARRAAGRDRGRPCRQPLGRPAGRRRRLRDRRLARRLRAGGRLARRRARDPQRGGRAARARRWAPAGGPAARRLGRRGGRALRPQPVRLVRLCGHARGRRGARPARPRRRAARGRGRPPRRRTRPRARVRRAQLRGACAYLELHIEQGPVLESRGEPAATVLGTCGVERHVAVFTGQAAHAGATPMELRRDSFAATAQAALAIREIGLSHEGGVCTVGGATSEPGVVTAVAGPHRDAARPAPPRPGRARHDARRGAPGLRAGGRRPGLRGRAAAPLVDPADPVRRAPDRLRARGRAASRAARTPPSRAGRCTTPPRWRG